MYGYTFKFIKTRKFKGMYSIDNIEKTASGYADVFI